MIKMTSQKNLRSASRTGGVRVGMPNPAAVYAEEQGLTVVSRTDAQGNQYGVITLPSGQEVNQWDYYRENYVRPTTPTRPPKAIIAKKMNLRPGDIILRQSQSISSTKKIINTPSFKKKLKVVAPQQKRTAPTKMIINIEQEKRSMFFS